MKTGVVNVLNLLESAAALGISDDQICKATRRKKCTLWRWRNRKAEPHPDALARIIRLINQTNRKETA